VDAPRLWPIRFTRNRIRLRGYNSESNWSAFPSHFLTVSSSRFNLVEARALLMLPAAELRDTVGS